MRFLDARIEPLTARRAARVLLLAMLTLALYLIVASMVGVSPKGQWLAAAGIVCGALLAELGVNIRTPKALTAVLALLIGFVALGSLTAKLLGWG